VVHFPSLALFIRTVLDQGRALATRFTTEPWSTHDCQAGRTGLFRASDPASDAISWRKMGIKKVGAESKTPVELFTRAVHRPAFGSDDDDSTATEDLPSRKETWFARRSTHLNDAVAGTATFNEMKEGLMAFHSEHEMEYTPNVMDAHRVLNWQVPTELKDGPYSEVQIGGTYPPFHPTPQTDTLLFGSGVALGIQRKG
jgi:hypothetical protein